MEVFVQRNYLGPFTARWLLIVGLRRSGPLLFQTLNRVFKPSDNGFFNFVAVGVAIERVERFARRVEWDMAAWDRARTMLGRHQVDQSALGTWLAIGLGIAVYARRRIFKNILGLPTGPRIAGGCEEIEFAF